MARSKEVVLDASIVVKWMLPERDSSAAVAIRDAHVEGRVRILAPELLWYELANSVRQRPGIQPEQARDGLRSFSDVQLALYRPTIKGMQRATDLALGTGLTVYDACYASLARDHECPLVTEDRELLRRFDLAIPLRSWRVPG